jgi:hypothetical protein
MSVETSGVVGLVINKEKIATVAQAFVNFGNADNKVIEEATIVRNILGPNPSWDVYSGYRTPALDAYMEERKVNKEAAERKWQRMMNLLLNLELGITIPTAPKAETKDAKTKQKQRERKVDSPLELQIREMRQKAKEAEAKASEQRNRDRDYIDAMTKRYHGAKSAEGDAVLQLMVQSLKALQDSMDAEDAKRLEEHKAKQVATDAKGNSKL